jgi:hypothetical protein
MYMKISPVRPNIWKATTSKATLPVATIIRHRGQCAVTAHRALNCAEVATLSIIMQDLEAA